MPAEPPASTRDNKQLWDNYAPHYQAGWHDELDGDVFWGPSMPSERKLRILGDVQGKDVLEIGCGGGQAGVHLATLGARVTALDLAPRQLEHAAQLARSRGVQVRLLEASADDLHMLDDASFDVAFSSFAMGFVERIDLAFREAHRVLRPGGLFAFSWGSPIHMSTTLASDGKSVFFDRSYFDRAPFVEEDELGRVVSFHRTYGDWHRALTSAGFLVADLVEPEPVGEGRAWKAIFPLAKLRQIPGTTIWVARKPA